MSMDTELKKKWIKALRSGKYKQGRNALKRNNEYCCLGVLCAVAKLDNTVQKVTNRTMFSYSGLEASAYLPETFRAVINLDPSVQWRLASMNDNANCVSFKDIADFIEKHA